jgi:hypothetical protein
MKWVVWENIPLIDQQGVITRFSLSQPKLSKNGVALCLQLRRCCGNRRPDVIHMLCVYVCVCVCVCVSCFSRRGNIVPRTLYISQSPIDEDGAKQIRQPLRAFCFLQPASSLIALGAIGSAYAHTPFYENGSDPIFGPRSITCHFCNHLQPALKNY